MMDFYETDGGRLCKTFKDDCVVRSISIAMRKNYKEVFEDLMALGLEMGAYPNHDKVWMKYLDDHGWIKNKASTLNCGIGTSKERLLYATAVTLRRLTAGL